MRDSGPTVTRAGPVPSPTAEGLRRYHVLIKDKESGASLAARVRVLSAHGTYLAPLGHRVAPVGPDATFKALGKPGDIMWQGPKAWAYLDGWGVLDVPGQRITIKAEKGPEYVPYERSVDLAAIPGDRIIVEMERWADWQQQGWYSGDTHLHEPDPAALVVETKAEDVSVSSVLVANNGDSWLAFPYFRPGLHPVSDATHLVQYGQEYRHNRLGHVNLLGIDRLFLPAPRLQPPPLAAGDWPTLVEVARWTQRRGGIVVWGHWPRPSAECPVVAALGAVDAFELLGIGDPLEKNPELDQSYALQNQTLRERYGRTVYDLSPLELYYLYLNCGFRIPISAGTDKYMAWRIAGGARVYVQLDGDLTYGAWIQGLKAGRSFVTTSPLLTLTVDEKPVGSRIALPREGRICVDATATSIRPYKRLEVVVNGEPILTTEPEGEQHKASIRHEINLAESAWIAARCIGDTWVRYGPKCESSLPIFAHTSPVYVDIPDHPLRVSGDAGMLLEQVLDLQEWIRHLASYDTETQRSEALKQAARAELVLRSILEVKG